MTDTEMRSQQGHRGGGEGDEGFGGAISQSRNGALSLSSPLMGSFDIIRVGVNDKQRVGNDLTSALLDRTSITYSYLTRIYVFMRSLQSSKVVVRD